MRIAHDLSDTELRLLEIPARFDQVGNGWTLPRGQLTMVALDGFHDVSEFLAEAAFVHQRKAAVHELSKKSEAARIFRRRWLQ